MRILLVEDEESVADRIRRLTEKAMGNRLELLAYRPTLASGLNYLQQHPIDLLMLDLNLNGQDGFNLLKELSSYSFHIMVVSANTHRALEAFEYGVLDFVPKPFTIERLQKAFARFNQLQEQREASTFYLTVRHRQGLKVIALHEIAYIKASNNYSELYTLDGNRYLHDKSLQNLELILPVGFKRIHRSYICNWQQVTNLFNHGGGKYELQLQNQVHLPISRNRYPSLKEEH